MKQVNSENIGNLNINLSRNEARGFNFEDAIYAASAFFTIYIVFGFIINLIMPQVVPELAWFISAIIPALIVGFIFGGKMANSKFTSIAKVLVLVTVLFGLFLPAIVGFIDWNNFVSTNPTITMQSQNFVYFMRDSLFAYITINFVPLIMATIPGLYIGLSLRKIRAP